MNRPEKQIFERLGPAGLTQVLDDVIEQKRLVRLANACGLKYPGMRTQSQERQRIVADLVDQSSSQVAARKAVYRELQKATLAASRAWNDLTADDKRARLADRELLATNGNLGLHLFLAARDTDGDAAGLEALLAMLAPQPQPAGSRAADSPHPAQASRDELRLKRSVAELQKKVRHLEGQLGKARESEKTAKRDLIGRKGELAESRMLAERLGSEAQAAKAELQKALARQQPVAETDTAALEKARKLLRELSAEQRKLVHQLRKVSTPPEAQVLPIEPLLETVQELKKELEGLKRLRSKELTEQRKNLEDLHTELLSLRKVIARTTRRKRNRGDEARVGVFVDVQNVYYGARRLKGKLDFGALLQEAVGSRRLIHATAYVVESKEIDQRGFIAVLHQRGLEVRRKPVRVRVDGSMKGDWDMELALDVLDLAKDLDVVVLVSGDGDFTSLVKRVKRMGPRVEVIGFPRHTAKSLIEAADTFLPLDRKFMIYPTRGKSLEPVPDEPELLPDAAAGTEDPALAGRSEKPRAVAK